MNRRMQVFVGSSMITLLAIVAVPSPQDVEESTDPVGAAPILAITWETVTDGADDRREMAERMARQRERADELDWGPSPFASAPAATVAGIDDTTNVTADPQLLTGISIAGESRLAIIGRSVVRPGDELSTGFTVVAIERGSVTLVRDGHEQTLELVQ